MVNLPIEYSDKSVTPFGGMAVMKRFLDQVGIREKLSALDLPEPGSNRGYSSEQIIESFWLNVWTGASRYVHCNWLREDQVIHDILAIAVCLRRAPIVVFSESSVRLVIIQCFQRCSAGSLSK